MNPEPQDQASTKDTRSLIAFALFIVTTSGIAIALDNHIGRALVTGATVGTTVLSLHLRRKLGAAQAYVIVALLCVLQWLVLLALIVGKRGA